MALAGPRVFSDMAMIKGRKYQLALDQKQDLKPYITVTSTGCQPAALQASCSSKGASGAVFGPVPQKDLEVYTFIAPKTATYTVGVGSAVETTFGETILNLKDITPL